MRLTASLFDLKSSRQAGCPILGFKNWKIGPISFGLEVLEIKNEVSASNPFAVAKEWASTVLVGRGESKAWGKVEVESKWTARKRERAVGRLCPATQEVPRFLRDFGS